MFSARAASCQSWTAGIAQVENAPQTAPTETVGCIRTESRRGKIELRQYLILRCPLRLHLLFIVALALAGPLDARLIDYTPFPCSCIAVGINDSGQLVGANTPHDGSAGGFFWDGTSFSSITHLGWSDLIANGVNDAGQVVGSAYYSGQGHSFLKVGNTFTTLDFPDAIGSQTLATYANAINNNGHVVGYYTDQSGEHGFYESGGTYSSIDYPGSFGNTAAFGIADTGQIVGDYSAIGGNQSFFLAGSTFRFFTYPGASTAVATGINSQLQIVGNYTDATGIHGFLKMGSSTISIDYPGATVTQVWGINNNGQIVGEYRIADSTGYSDHSFIGTYTGTVPTITESDIGPIAPLAPPPNPVPEPSSYVLLSAAILILLALPKGRELLYGLSRRIGPRSREPQASDPKPDWLRSVIAKAVLSLALTIVWKLSYAMKNTMGEVPE